jgi:hypothetical protein
MALAPNVPTAPSGARIHGMAITPGTTVYSPPLTSLWIGVSGSLVVTLAGDTVAVTIPLVPAATQFNDYQIINVGSATTCSDIVGFW